MRIAGRIRIESAAQWLPPHTVTLEEALGNGLLHPEDVEASGYRQLPVSTDLAAPEMAVLAAERALRAAGRTAAELSLTAHAWTYFQGHDFWSPAHYVAHRLSAPAVPFGVQQMCNGGAIALELAVARLLAAGSAGAALVTTADRFAAPGFDRWRGDYGVLYGDGATAAVLATADGRSTGLELLSITTVAASELESMHRGDLPFATGPNEHSSTVDVRRTKKSFLAAVGKDAFGKTVADGVRCVLAATLADADVAPDDPRLRHVLLPRLGCAGRETIYLPGVASVTAAPCLDLGDDTGHLGAGDALANLSALEGDAALRPGELALVLSAGAGFTWTGMVVAAPAAGPTGTADRAGRTAAGDPEEVNS